MFTPHRLTQRQTLGIRTITQATATAISREGGELHLASVLFTSSLHIFSLLHLSWICVAEVITEDPSNNITDVIFSKLGVNLHQ